MKTLIVYGSEYGYTKDSVLSLGNRISGEVMMVNPDYEKVPDIMEFDNIIIGGSIYMGQIQKKIKEFCINNISLLKSKKLAFFISCAFPDNFETNLKNSFPEELLDLAVIKVCIGGELRMDKMKFMHKTITKMMKKAQEKENKPPIKNLSDNIFEIAEKI